MGSFDVLADISIGCAANRPPLAAKQHAMPHARYAVFAWVGREAKLHAACEKPALLLAYLHTLKEYPIKRLLLGIALLVPRGGTLLYGITDSMIEATG